MKKENISRFKGIKDIRELCSCCGRKIGLLGIGSVRLTDDNVGYLIDFMERFMMTKSDDDESDKSIDKTSDTSFMQEMDEMRIKAKPYFSAGIDYREVWEEAVDKKYGNFN